MENDDRWDDQVRETYRRPLPGEDEARERAIARLRREPRVAGGTGAWGGGPGALPLPPLAAAASVALLLLLGAWAGAAWMGSQFKRARAVAAIATEPSTPVTFVFRAPGASTVTLVGDFNGWDPNATPLRRAALSDAWTAQVP